MSFLFQMDANGVPLDGDSCAVFNELSTDCIRVALLETG